MADFREITDILASYDLQQYSSAIASRGVTNVASLKKLDAGQCFDICQNRDDCRTLCEAIRSLHVDDKNTTDSRRVQSFISDEDKENLLPVVEPGRGRMQTDVLPEHMLGAPKGRRVRHKTARTSVAVRKRPLAAIEAERGEQDVLLTDSLNAVLRVDEPKTRLDMSTYVEKHFFCFDHVFSTEHSNADVYERLIPPLLDTTMCGGSATVFAYGQTGSGKTHTMLGPSSEPGVYKQAAVDIFKRLANSGCVEEGQSLEGCLPRMEELEVEVSFFEIYGNRLHDLLNKKAVVSCRDNGKGEFVYSNLQVHVVKDSETLINLIEQGHSERAAGVTSANDTSSRSHAILNVHLVREGKKGGRKVVGRAVFVDLAGSERGADTLSCAKVQRQEGAEINKSLLALKECIRGLDSGSPHIPFRQCKLTEVLRSSFIGDAQTLMVGNLSPCSSSTEQTMNTLRYAERVKEFKNDVKSSAAKKSELMVTCDDTANGKALATKTSIESSSSDRTKKAIQPSRSSIGGDSGSRRPATQSRCGSVGRGAKRSTRSRPISPTPSNGNKPSASTSVKATPDTPGSAVGSISATQTSLGGDSIKPMSELISYYTAEYSALNTASLRSKAQQIHEHPETVDELLTSMKGHMDVLLDFGRRYLDVVQGNVTYETNAEAVEAMTELYLSEMRSVQSRLAACERMVRVFFVICVHFYFLLFCPSTLHTVTRQRRLLACDEALHDIADSRGVDLFEGVTD